MRTLILLTGLFFSTVVSADIVLSYDGFYSRMKRAQQPEFSDVTLAFVLHQQGTEESCQPIELYLQSDIHHVPLSMAGNGEINLPYDEALKDSKAKLIIELADNRAPCELKFLLRSRMLLDKTLTGQQLQHYQQQFTGLMNKLAGMSRYWMPAVTGVRLEFSAESGQPVLSEPALEALTRCQQSHCVIELKDLSEQAQWQFSRAPVYLTPFLENGR